MPDSSLWPRGLHRDHFVLNIYCMVTKILVTVIRRDVVKNTKLCMSIFIL